MKNSQLLFSGWELFFLNKICFYPLYPSGDGLLQGKAANTNYQINYVVFKS
jgi:hypothetical protein